MPYYENNGCLVQAYRLFLIVALKGIFPLFMVVTMFLVPGTIVYTLIWAAACVLLFSISKDGSALRAFAMPALVTLFYVVMWVPIISARVSSEELRPFLLYCSPFLCLILFSNIGFYLRHIARRRASVATSERRPQNKIGSFLNDEKKQSKFWKILGISVGAALALAIVIFTTLSAYSTAKRYESAVAFENNSDYIKAQQIYRELGNYKDSQARVEALQPQVLATAQCGDLITFGIYRSTPIQWIVLERKEDKIYVLSLKSLFYYTREGTEGEVDYSITPIITYGNWETSKMRIWLNDTFYNTAFSLEEQSRILDTLVVSDKYQKDPENYEKLIHLYDIETTDKIFLLSKREAYDYTEQSQLLHDLIFYGPNTDCAPAPVEDESEAYREWALLDAGYAYVEYSEFFDDYSIVSGNTLKKEAYARPVLWLSTTQ